MPSFQNLTGELPARIGDKRRPGITDQGERFAIFQSFKQFRPSLRPIMVMVGCHTSFDAMRIEQFSSDAGVFCKDLICACQRVQSAKCDVAKIADRCGNYVKAWIKRLRGFGRRFRVA